MNLQHLIHYTGLTIMLTGVAFGAAGLLQDGDFAGQASVLSRPWEVRYGLKASEPSSRPRWEVLPKKDEDGETYVSYDQTGPAAGTVLIGQRLRVPEQLPGSLAASVTYQTYCAQPDRSGIVQVGLCLPQQWDDLSPSPDDVQPVSFGDWLYVAELHDNGDDVTAWETRQTEGGELGRVLRRHAGKEVVAVVAWTTWHPTATEWFRLKRMHLGEPEPWLRWAVTPSYTVKGEPFSVAIRAYAPGNCQVEVGVQAATAEKGSWEWLPCEPRDDHKQFYIREIDGETAPDAVRARLICDGKEFAALPPVSLRTITRPQHPCVFFTPAMIKEMKERIDRFGWAAAQFEKHRENADSWLEPVEMPDIAPGGWSHDYVCPDDGSRLRWRADFPTQHLCPACGKEWSDKKRNAIWRSTLHGRFAGGLRDLGLAYQLTGETRYAEAGRRILLWYAEHYLEYPEGRGPAGRGRVNSQSLSECSWLIRMMEGADLLFPALTREEKRAIEQGLLRPAVEQISQFRFGIHNIQCWHNACMAITGYFLGDPEWVARGTEGPIGFHAQVERGILEDGMWYERSLGYHNYTLRALVAHCEVARNNGDELYKIGRIRKMFTVPLRMAQPNLVPPSLNDQGYRRGAIGTFPLEMAWAWYDDTVAAGALKYLYDRGRTRGGLDTLKYAKPLPEYVSLPAAGSVNMPGAGLAILRLGGRDGVCAMLEYGEHGGGHGHPDKLQVILYGLDRTLCPDLGTTGYGVPLHSQWYKTTPSHNTVTIGTRNQHRASGTLLGFETGDGWAAAAAETTEAYPEWRLQRSIFLTEEFMVDCFEIQGETQDTLDWFLRAPGSLALSLPVQAVDEKAANRTYAYLREMQGAVSDQVWQAVWTLPDAGKRLLLTMSAAPETHIVQCLAPGVAGQDPWGTIRVRRQGSQTRFVAVYQFVDTEARPAAVEFTSKAVRIGGLRLSLPDADQPLMGIW